jgi:protein gp37
MKNSRNASLFHFAFVSNNPTVLKIASNIIEKKEKMKTTKIEWTDKTWNSITSCSKRPIRCTNYYAEIMSSRLCVMGREKYKNGFNLTLHEEVLNEPLEWKNPHTIFVCSMSDLFHEEVSFCFIDKVLETIEATPQHLYQLLTKRDKCIAKYFANCKVPNNAWLGVTVEVKTAKDRFT